MPRPLSPFRLSHLTLALLVVQSIWLAACAGTVGGSREPTPDELRAYEDAVALRERDPVAAGEAFDALLARYPDSPLTDESLEQLAGLSLESGYTDRAIELLDQLVGEYGREASANRGRLTLAQIHTTRGDLELARRHLKEIRFSKLDADTQLRTYEMLVAVAEEPVEKMAWLAALRGMSPEEDLADVDAEIDALIEGMQAVDLERAAGRLDEQVPAARIHLALAARALEAGDFRAAEQALDRAEARLLAGEDMARLDELRSIVGARAALAEGALPTFAEVATRGTPRTEGASGTIGVVLPLSGPFARYGEDTLHGILLAARVFRSGELPPVSAPGDEIPPRVVPGRLRILVRDTGGDPQRARAAVKELAQRDELVAIIGPLLSSSSEAAAEAAEEEGVPLLALTSKESVSRGREHVFRLRTTPGDEVEVLAEHAFEKLGARRFAILYPADSYGRGMRARFYDAVRARGGDVVALSSYDPKATDFAGPIRKMIGYDLLSDEEKTALRERDDLLRRARRMTPEDANAAREEAEAMTGPDGEPLPPIVDFDALFIPDAHDKAVLIAPQLAFHEVLGVRLLGPSGWHDSELTRIGRKHVSGAVFASLFDPQSRYPFVADFVARYRATYGSVPDVFAAQGFDAANLVLVQLAAGRESRRELRSGVLRTQAYPGVSGVTSILPDGNARKRPYLLGVRRGEIEPLD